VRALPARLRRRELMRLSSRFSCVRPHSQAAILEPKLLYTSRARSRRAGVAHTGMRVAYLSLQAVVDVQNSWTAVTEIIAGLEALALPNDLD